MGRFWNWLKSYRPQTREDWGLLGLAVMMLVGMFTLIATHSNIWFGLAFVALTIIISFIWTEKSIKKKSTTNQLKD